MGGARVSMDIGGTFTDVVVYDETDRRHRIGKYPTTPADLAAGVLEAVASVVDQPADISFLVHGTTQGLNSLLQRRGVRVLLLASAGARDVYHIARGPRTRMYDLHFSKPRPLVPRRDVAGIDGRLDASGAELEPLDERAVRTAAARYRDEGFGGIAVAYLFSHLNPVHELRTREILLEELGTEVTLSLSHETANEWREYERTSSAVVESYIGPAVRGYLARLGDELARRGMTVPLHVMQSSGGMITAESARRRPLQTLLSGPVGGTMGGVALAAAMGRPNLIYVDMGGTSFDVSVVVDGKPDVAPEVRLDGLPMLMSAVNIHTVGAGGGSVAWVEAGGLRVGPRSAGARPGPACYGNGGEQATVTDANLVLGRIEPESFAGGRVALHPEAALSAVTGFGRALGMDTLSAAEGICAVANAKMAQAIRTITVARGIEPRDFGLVAFGGAGPMHAVFLARELGIREVVVPRFPGAFSAWGMLQTEIRRDLTEPYYRLDADVDGAELADRLAGLAEQGLRALDGEGVPEAARRVEHAVDLRYAAQEYALTVPLEGADEPARPAFLQAVAARFGKLHEQRHGHANPGAPVEFVALRTTVYGDLGKPAAERLARAEGDFPRRGRPVVFDGEAVESLIVDRADLLAGHAFQGPALVLEPTATTVVPPGYAVRVDDLGSLVIEEER
ncbi:hydantoinase/oxoprolinase family protein [Allokutzneria sp. A3M-2-11 16]|uniref:hydantoinase/oxoprolinase family protein n=1 Tax=Allokutzneria sp. A3M-2-11 16 TaxID=2962043 RepID=UPI0020B65FF0|nr:hydantoinase/oxoprolinase family protein [Allokutzneria sp. A3M-2-11 16]MCP3803964.1 hydantoinase/oxoprolinase family protein [Allokutzneria sp. A3M-2-11 16]